MFRLCIVVVAVTALALLAVAEQVTTIRAGYVIDELRRERDRLAEKRHRLDVEVGRLETPEALQYRAAALHLDLAIPDKPRVVRVRPRPTGDHAWAQYDAPGARTASRGR